MPTDAASVELRPQFSLAALLLVLVGIAIVGNTLVGGMPDRLLKLGAGKSSTPAKPGIAPGSAGTVLGPPAVSGTGPGGGNVGGAAIGIAPGSAVGPGGPTQYVGPNTPAYLQGET